MQMQTFRVGDGDSAGAEEIATACGKLLSRLKDRNTRVRALK